MKRTDGALGLIRPDSYSIFGQRVTTLVNDQQPAGFHRVIWDGRNKRGIPVTSGVYFLKIVAGEFVKEKKILVLR